MLGFRLSLEDERALARFARETRRTKSDIAREAVQEYLRRHALDVEWRRQIAALADEKMHGGIEVAATLTDELLREEPDFDWGEGKP